MFSRHTYQAMTPHSPAEILDSDLSPLLLELAAWGAADPSGFSWLDPPPVAALSTARQLLADLSALDDAGRVTPLGRAMARLPLHPRLSRLLLRAKDLGCPDTGCDLAALLSERDIVRRSPGGNSSGRNVTSAGERLELFREWRSTGRTGEYVDVGALKGVERASGQLRRLLGVSLKMTSDNGDTASLGRLLLAAYPDRVARLREADEGRYLLANGRGARLASAVAVTRIPLLVAVSVAGGDLGEGVIHLAETVSEELLRDELGQRVVTRDQIDWDTREGRVVAARGDFIGAVCLSSRAFTPGPEALLPTVIEAVRASGLGLISRNEAFLQLQARLLLVRLAFPGDGWPDVTDAALLESLYVWLAPFAGGVRNAQQLAAVNCAAALLSLLDYRQRQALDELAPTHLTVPSGSRIRLDYCGGELPVLAVKLQELFGLAETPTIAEGRVAVLLHLLSPGGRPLQVTQDLKGFWDGSYHQVKKEMKGRYPRHPWPDDPWNAAPTRRAKPRGT